MQLRLLVSLTMAMALAALVLSVYSLISRPSEKEIADRVYQEMLSEAWTEAKPMYDQLAVRSKKPSTFRELFAPLFEMAPSPSMETQPAEHGEGNAKLKESTR